MVTADAAEHVLAPWRARHDRSAFERRIPAHITILFPLVPATAVDDDLLAALAALYVPVAPFAYELERLDSFPGIVWLRPEPAAPFHALIARTRAAFPGSPPYGDPTLEPEPHCTVGVPGDRGQLATTLAELQAGLAPVLPIRCEARAVSLLEERSDETWLLRATFPFAGGG